MNNLNTLGQCLSNIQQTILTLSVRQLEMAQELRAMKKMINPAPDDSNQQKINLDTLMKDIQVLKQEFKDYRLKGEVGAVVEIENTPLESIFSENTPSQPVPDDIEIIPKKKKAPPKKKSVDV